MVCRSLKWHLLNILLFFLPFVSWCQEMTLSRQLVFKEMGKQNTNAFLEDSYGFIWIGGSGGLFRYDGYSIEPFKHPVPGDSALPSTGAVYALLEDSKKGIWIGAANGLFRYGRETDSIKGNLIHHPSFYKGDSRILSLFEDHSGRLWVGGREHLFVTESVDIPKFQAIEGIKLGTWRQGALGFLSILESQEGEVFVFSNDGLWLIYNDFSFQQFLPEKWQNAVGEFQVLDAAADKEGLFWLATNDGLWIFDPEKRSFSKMELPRIVRNVMLQVLIDNEGEIWLGTQEDGLLKLKEGHFEHFPYDSNNPYSLNDHRVQALLKDRFNNLWIGTMFGINRINFEQQKFPFYQIDPGPYRRDNYTFRVMEDSLGGFWFRLLRFGLGYCPGPGEKIEILLQPDSGSDIEEIKNFCMDPEGNVWVITLTKGLYFFEKGRKTYRYIDLGDSMKNAYTHTILSDRIDDQYLWFSTRFGLCRMNRFTLGLKCFYPEESLDWMDNNSMSHIRQSEDGKIWCTLRSKGVNRIGYFDIKDEKFVAKPGQPEHPSFITFNRTWQIQSVPGNKIWIGTDNGLIIIDSKKESYILLTKEKDLPLKHVQSIMPGLEGNIWFTGDTEICKTDTANLKYWCFDARDNIESFNSYSATRGKDGRITFGGSNGIYSFYPDEIEFRQDTTKPKVYLTNFEVLNEVRHLDSAYELVKKIELHYTENAVSFEFAGLHFIQPERIQYRYKLENADRNWVETGSDRRIATYTNLSPGHYTFKVQATLSDRFDGVAEEGLSIDLIIFPPWYKTWWAYTLYVLAIAGLLFGIRRYELRRQLVKAEARQLKELDAFKSHFYTNITHEFRTPLTLILGEAKWLRKQSPQYTHPNIDRISRSGSQLLGLVNEILDLSKLDAGAMSLQNIQADIILFIRYLVDSFQSLAKGKNINLAFSAESEVFFMDFDPAKLRYVVVNLLSNAIKFTPANGKVIFMAEAREESLKITVEDNGVGISKEELPRIFDRFYQAGGPKAKPEGGTGIGLALTKELVQLMQGQLSIESELEKGSTFTVLLPVTRLEAIEAPDVERPAFVESETSAPGQPLISSAPNPEAPRLLIIEDSPDIVAFIVNLVKTDYHILSAPNGAKGVELALAEIPDIIISDVMMPEMDGFEVVRRLKENLESSHIPIIMLTARADFESRMEGLGRGADAYLAKPFEERELKLRLHKLLENRKRLQQYYTSSAFINQKDAPPAELAQLGSKDQEFLQNFLALVGEHLSDSNFSAEALSESMFMTYGTCLRKVKAATGMTVIEYLRHIRMQRAAQRLRAQLKTPIGDIAEAVGYASQAYFTRDFQKVFGCSPSKYRKQK